MNYDEYELVFDSAEHRQLLGYLNRATRRDGAVFHFDYFSGAYRFDDEKMCIDEEDDLALIAVDLLRYLWAYRISLVRNAPRCELSHWWDDALKFAPNWAGFTAERCNQNAIALADHCKLASRKMTKDLIALMRECPEPKVAHPET